MMSANRTVTVKNSSAPGARDVGSGRIAAVTGKLSATKPQPVLFGLDGHREVIAGAVEGTRAATADVMAHVGDIAALGEVLGV